MSTQTSNRRRRGVQASRLKLTRALNEAGLATQAALAERIADLEDLDSAPRDMVNRAFREQPVEVRSLDRIALALGVEAHTLYRDASEPAAPPEPAPANHPGSTRRWSTVIATVSAIAISLVLSLWLQGTPLAPGTTPASPEPERLTLGDRALLVLPFSSPSGVDFTAPLRQALAADFNVASATALGAADTTDLNTLARRLRLDVIVQGEAVVEGRLTGIRVFAFADGVRQQVWAESLPSVALPAARLDIAARAAAALRHAAGLASGDLLHYPLAPVQDDYLKGEYYLDQPSNELNLKRAQTRFETALRQDANYARAHAGLCHALLEAFWMLEEDRMLMDASRACSQALLLNPEDPVVATAHALFLRRTGRNAEAIDRYREVIARAPDHAPAHAGLSASYLDSYRNSGDREVLNAAMAAARRAADVDPGIWKPLFNLAAMYWFAGDVDGAITASEAALARDENEYVLANLGTFYLCAGAFAQARDAYRRAQQIAPASYVGDEFLGTAHYFLGEFDESVHLRKRAIASIGDGKPEVHEMWGHLGDAYRQQGNRDAAIDAYRRAARIAERDHLRGTMPAADRAARAYYYTVLGSLDVAIPPTVDRAISAQLEEIEAAQVEPTAHRRMAQIWHLRGHDDKALAALTRASATCPGYRALPDLAGLGQTAILNASADVEAAGPDAH